MELLFKKAIVNNLIGASPDRIQDIFNPSVFRHIREAVKDMVFVLANN